MDGIYKTLIFDGEVSLSVIEDTHIVNRAIKYHNLTQLTAAALGRTMTASLFMASFLKSRGEKLSVTIAGDGVGGHIIVSVDSQLRIRGYIENPEATLPLNEKGKLDVRGCVGKGKINVIRNMGLKGMYTGSSEIISGEIAEDFAYYYTKSEQQPTAMALGVRVNGKQKCLGAGGIVIQTMPGCSEESITKAEELINKFSNISSMMEKLGAKGIIDEYFKEYEFTYSKPVYKCICSRRFIDKVVISIGKEEAYDIVDEMGKIEVDCQYCDKKYFYTKEDLDILFK